MLSRTPPQMARYNDQMFINTEENGAVLGIPDLVSKSENI